MRIRLLNSYEANEVLAEIEIVVIVLNKANEVSLITYKRLR